jgi:hypothetical protein
MSNGKMASTNHPILLRHNLRTEPFRWLWSKYVTAINSDRHCTHCLKGHYSKRLSKHNKQLNGSGQLLLDERGQEDLLGIYICGVRGAGYPKTNYAHNLHAALVHSPGASDTFQFEEWSLEVENAHFVPIQDESSLLEPFASRPSEFTTCRIFRWAVSALQEG